MTYNIRDVVGFPPPAPDMRTVDWQTLCDMVDRSVDYPVTYAFGGAAPNTLKIGANGNANLYVAMGRADSVPVGYGSTRLFIEFSPYAWNPNSPDYSGE